MGLWAWAQEAYGRPGVAEAGLRLQDQHGQSISFLLWAAWARPDAPMAAQGVEAACAWNRVAVAPLREARRGLKFPCPTVDDANREALRDLVRTAELESERILLAALERLGERRDGPLEPALRAASAAWGPPAPDAALAAFAAALG